ncbi:hypothetical protein SUGI_1086350 [Cryptomeria japonica]|nr:hypothetical protein SUGI_1086350 [Cryptomeria japonica]
MQTFCGRLLLPLLALWFTIQFVSAKHTVITRRYNFTIQMTNVTRLCTMKALLTVNGQYPGPPVVAREGDRVVIKVTNNVKNNISIHWHGIRQLRSGWADGPAYRGTLWWHAHISWLRASIHGPIIIYLKKNVSYPFPRPHQEVPVVFGEWWNADTETVINQAMQSGAQANVSDAYTINGLPGLMYNCSTNDTFRLKVNPGKTYLLRIVNAALNSDLF